MGKWPLVASVAGATLLADQLSKLAIWSWLAPDGRVTAIPGFFDLAYVLNTGVAFGFMSGSPSLWRVAFLAGMALLALSIIVVFIIYTDPADRLLLWGLSLVSGGAVGNVVDRVRMGAVIDFLDVYVGALHWPAFNVADMGISIGTGLILLHLWLNRH